MCSLTINGKNIWPILLPYDQNQQTEFFPLPNSFAKSPEKTEVTKNHIEDGYECVTIKYQMHESDEEIDINALSHPMQMSTVFSTVKFNLEKQNIDTMKVTSHLQTIESDKVAHVVRKAVQRGIVLGNMAGN